MLRGLVYAAAMIVVRLFQGALINAWQTQAGLFSVALLLLFIIGVVVWGVRDGRADANANPDPDRRGDLEDALQGRVQAGGFQIQDDVALAQRSVVGLMRELLGEGATEGCGEAALVAPPVALGPVVPVPVPAVSGLVGRPEGLPCGLAEGFSGLGLPLGLAEPLGDGFALGLAEGRVALAPVWASGTDSGL